MSRSTPDDLHEILGPRALRGRGRDAHQHPGVATGLAWTPVGGDILFIEATRIPGKGGLILTGQLGEVMRESAQAALSLVKGRAVGARHRPEAVRERATSTSTSRPARSRRTGRRAGVAMFTALVSLLTGRTVRSDTAMTGEISLRGLVLPVGGIKEKVVAAARAGLSTVILPARNRKDYEDIPEAARNELRFVWAERVEDVIDAALDPPPRPRRRARVSSRVAGPYRLTACRLRPDLLAARISGRDSDFGRFRAHGFRRESDRDPRADIRLAIDNQLAAMALRRAPIQCSGRGLSPRTCGTAGYPPDKTGEWPRLPGPAPCRSPDR